MHEANTNSVTKIIIKVYQETFGTHTLETEQLNIITANYSVTTALQLGL